MKLLTDKNEIEQTHYYMLKAMEEAKKSRCKKSNRGAMIVKGGEIIGKGYKSRKIS